MTLLLKICPAKLAAIFMITASASAWAADSTVNVLYAGSLVNIMERSVGSAFEQKSGDRFQGFAGGSNKLANEIKGKLRRGDIFVSANPKVDEQLMGQANGDWVRWYIAFAESPLVIGCNPSSRFVNDHLRYPHFLYDLALRLIAAQQRRSFITSDHPVSESQFEQIRIPMRTSCLRCS